jgi:hypothetical protein
MTNAEEIRERASRINQRAALKTSFAFLGLADSIAESSPTIFGQERTAFIRRVSECTASAFRKGHVMSDGFTLTVCYGEDSLLPRVPNWIASIRPNANYVFGFDRVAGAMKLSEAVDAAFLKIDGHRLKKLVEHLLHRAQEDQSCWPCDLLWVEESLASGVVFDEYAGEPRDPPGADDKRIFEVSCW